MRKYIGICAAALILQGCAIPVPLQIASWVIDGVSIIATQKSITDHGISMLAQKDCSLWRGVSEGQVCQEYEDGWSGDALIADADFEAKMTSSAGTQQSADTLETTLEAALGTALGTAKNAESIQAKAPDDESITPVRLFTPEETQVQAGVYVVIGSSRDLTTAYQIAGKHPNLSPIVLTSNSGKKNVHRVIVGPVHSGGESNFINWITEQGVLDTWSIRIEPKDWITNQATHASKASPASELMLATLQN